MLLYKYKSFEVFHQAVDILLNQRIYCPTPSQLNDPLEGLLGVTLPEHPETESFDKKMMKSFRFWLAAKYLLDKHRICSFSASPVNPLMWSYYGSGHSGMCLELDVSEWNDSIFPVEYVDDLAIIDQSSIQSLLKYKLVDWKHEEEYRMVFDHSDSNTYINANIKTVIIGSNIRQEYIKILFEICKLKQYKIEFISFNTSGKASRVPIDLNYFTNLA